MTVENLPLWKELVDKTKDVSNLSNVKQLVHYAAVLLDRVIETFPRYTSHNQKHSKNVIRIIGELLGREGLKKLKDFECAILVLAAFFHDIGMVYKEKERNKLIEEEEFAEFKKKYPEVRLRIESQEELPKDITEWYCRWAHPKRVFRFLEEKKNLLEWNGFYFGEELGFVCQSHGEDISFVTGGNHIQKDFNGEYDLRFCAIILRLADILDFDRSRSPKDVYEYLDLDNPGTTGEVLSREEWLKHLAAGGFKLINRELYFYAQPKHPAVEYGIRRFLETIDNELKNCVKALQYCSRDWQDFKLPDKISKVDIKSQGYIYGDYRFKLEHGSLLDLLMSENMYMDKYVFVRELFQNSIDAVRHRVFYEEVVNHNKNIKDELWIEVNDWRDKNGYHWVRIDDCGMGMDRNIIENYLLKIGQSYYQSTDFKAEILSYKPHGLREFNPISRFGIGILSCFIAGDRIEISTRHNNSEPIRLSIDKPHGFFTLQIKGQHKLFKPNPMPHKKIGESDYRKNCGTSVAVRLDPTKESGDFNLEALLKKYLLYPNIQIRVNGKSMFESLDKKELENVLNNYEKELENFPQKSQYTYTIPISKLTNSNLELDNRLITAHNNIIVPALPNFDDYFFSLGPDFIYWTGILLLYDKLRPELSVSRDNFMKFDWNTYSALHYAIFKSLKKVGRVDKVRQNLNIFEEYPGKEDFMFGTLNADPLINNDIGWTKEKIICVIKVVLKTSQDENQAETFIYDDTVYSADQVIEIILLDLNLIEVRDFVHMDRDRFLHINESNILDSDFLYGDSRYGGKKFAVKQLIVSTLLQMHFNIFFEARSKRFFIGDNSNSIKLNCSELEVFPSMFFVPYLNSDKLRIGAFPLNFNHNFSKWLIRNANQIMKKYPRIFYSIRQIFAGAIDVKKIQEIVKAVNDHVKRLYTLDRTIIPRMDTVLLGEKDFELYVEPMEKLLNDTSEDIIAQMKERESKIGINFSGW